MINETATSTKALSFNISLKTIETFACFLNMAGALVLSLNNEYSKFAYILWLISSPANIYVMVKYKHAPTALMNVFYFITSTIGFYKYWV